MISFVRSLVGVAQAFLHRRTSLLKFGIWETIQSVAVVCAFRRAEEMAFLLKIYLSHSREITGKRAAKPQARLTRMHGRHTVKVTVDRSVGEGCNFPAISVSQTSLKVQFQLPSLVGLISICTTYRLQQLEAVQYPLVGVCASVCIKCLHEYVLSVVIIVSN